MTVRPSTPARNVVAAWLGLPVPRVSREQQRNKTRAGYRKTGRKRTPSKPPAERAE